MGKRIPPSEEIISILKAINIQARYLPSKFTNEETNYACFEITSPKEFVEPLEEMINRHAKGENLTRVQTIGIKETERGIEYHLEIVPDEGYFEDPREKERETQKFLEKLPKEIRNYIRIHGKK